LRAVATMGGRALAGADPADLAGEAIERLRKLLPVSAAEVRLAGGSSLASYGPDVRDEYRKAGVYTGRLLQGAKPADLPILQPTKFELVINLKTARSIGLNISDSFQLLADEVIE